MKPAALCVALLALGAGPAARAQGAPPAAPAAPPSATAETPSFLELAERLRSIDSFSACTVEALRYAYDRPADRARGFERAALCLTLAGRPGDAHRLMLALPGEGTPLGASGRLRVCLSEVFLPELDAPACPALVSGASRDRLDELGRQTLRMRAIHAGRWEAARLELAAPAPPGADATVAGWQAQDRELLRRHDTLPRKSPVLAAALSMMIPGLGRVYLGRWPDGLLSFLLVGSTAALAAQGFYADGRGSVRGWIVGGVSGLLYAGNVYGSAIGALVQRRDAESALLQEVDRAYQGRLDP